MAWKYQEVLNQDLAILLVIALGLVSVLRWFRIFKREDASAFSTFIFKFLLPAAVIQGLGLKTDLYDDNIWRFVGAWLVLRAFMLLACTLVFGLGLRESLGEVTANWMSTTWISTVILGTPILNALFGTLGPTFAPLGIVAGISSWIFQLPLMLVFFEVHCWRQAHLYGTLPLSSHDDPLHPSRTPDPAALGYEKNGNGNGNGEPSRLPEGALVKDSVRSTHVDLPQDSSPQQQAGSLPGGRWDHVRNFKPSWTQLKGIGMLPRGLWDDVRNFRLSRAQLKGIGLRMLHNHVLWGCLVGIILNLSKIGPKWLDPGTPPACKNPTYAIGAGFIAILLDYFARCVEPVAFFSTGMWMHQKNPLGCGVVKAAFYMLVKLVLVPALMVGCAAMVGLEGAYARSAVILAALPVSSATFALCKSYGVGEAIAVANVVLGNILILPTTIAWLSFMDAVDLFNYPPNAVGPGCRWPQAKPKAF